MNADGVDSDSADGALAARVAAADRGEAAPPGQGAPPELVPPLVVDRAAQFRDGALYFGGVLRTMFTARVQAHWTDERLNALGVALGKCAERYGWNFDPVHPVAQLGAAALPLLWPIAEPVVTPYLRLLAPKPAANEPAHAPAASAPASPAPASAAAAVAEASVTMAGPRAFAEMDVAPRTAFPPRDQRVKPIEDAPVS